MGLLSAFDRKELAVGDKVSLTQKLVDHHDRHDLVDATITGIQLDYIEIQTVSGSVYHLRARTSKLGKGCGFGMDSFEIIQKAAAAA